MYVKSKNRVRDAHNVCVSCTCQVNSSSTHEERAASTTTEAGQSSVQRHALWHSLVWIIAEWIMCGRREALIIKTWHVIENRILSMMLNCFALLYKLGYNLILPMFETLVENDPITICL